MGGARLPRRRGAAAVRRRRDGRHAVPGDQPRRRLRRGARAARRHADGHHQRRPDGREHAAGRRGARIRSGGGGEPADRRHDDAQRRVVRVPPPGRGRRHRVLRARLDRRVVARRHAPGDASISAFTALGAMGLALLGSITLARLLARSDRPAVDVAGADGRDARRHLAAAADRIEPGARRAHRDVQRPDGVGGARRSRDRGGVHRRHPRARDGARRARSVHRRPLRSRQRAVGGHRPRRCRSRPTISKSSGSARCSTTSARSACRTMCCESPGR